MREIKFQAFIEKDGKIEKYSCGVFNNEVIISTNIPYVGQAFVKLTSKYGKLIGLRQYTGLKDKNGKEIYAGDIVRGKYGKNGIVKNYEIRWLIGHFAAVDRNNITGDEHYYPIGLLEGEVIGNIFQDGDLLRDSQSPDRNRIYENPELLEGEKHD